MHARLKANHFHPHQLRHAAATRWRREFGARQDLLGKSITLGSQPYVVIGILGAGFETEQFSQPPDAWVPFQLDPNSRDTGAAQWEWSFRRLILCPQ